VAGLIGIVGWIGAVDGHSSPPSVGTQFRIRLTLGNGSGPGPVQGWPSGASVWSTETEGRDLVVDQVEVSEADAPEHVRALLGLEQGAGVVLRSRRYVLDGKPVLLSRSWLPAAIASGTPIARPETGPGGIYARLADLGHAPARFREDIRSRMPLPAEADRLQIAAGTPVVEICRVAVDADGTPVEVNEMTADSSAYVFRYEFGA
jgi:GntR family transcriptional regulator